MTDKQKDKLARNRELIEASEYMSVKELSERFGLSIPRVYSLLAKREAGKIDIYKLFAQVLKGKRASEIAKALGCSVQAVSYHLKKINNNS